MCQPIKLFLWFYRYVLIHTYTHARMCVTLYTPFSLVHCLHWSHFRLLMYFRNWFLFLLGFFMFDSVGILYFAFSSFLSLCIFLAISLSRSLQLSFTHTVSLLFWVMSVCIRDFKYQDNQNELLSRMLMAIFALRLTFYLLSS